MTLVLVSLALGFGSGFGMVTAWRLRDRLATAETRDLRAEADNLALLLGQAFDDYIAEHDRWADVSLRLFNAEERLREMGMT